jgi:two-component system response regulator MtrA
MTARVLVVDDDPALAEMLGIVLRGEGLEPAFVADGDAALGAFRREKPDVVLLDLMLPGTDGVEVCRQIRAESGVPIIMLTAKGDTTDIVLGLECGADDYVVKPFKPKELVARVRARLRNHDGAPESLTIGPVDDPVTIDVPGHVFTREVLLEQVWGYRHAADTRLVNVHVQRLRAKVERDPEHPSVVLTVRGVGYKAGPG